MPLIDRIDKALDAGVDTELFERAVVALLASRYEWVSPVEGGRDIGRDGDIYRVGADRRARGRILATTGDPLRNLKSSHKSWKKEDGFRVDELVIACSNQVTGGARKKIDDYCEANDLPLPEIYGRDWLIEQLRRNPEWREMLTGVRGRLDAISAYPASPVDQATELLERTEPLGALRAAIQPSRTVLLVGVPGVGKSRLLAEIGMSVLHAHPDAAEYAADDLMHLEPDAVVLDDAHLHIDFLTELVRLRTQEGLSFALIVSCWPEHDRQIRSITGDADLIPLEPLARKSMDTIVRQLGVTAVWARRAILDQAKGRPGWAHMLCQTLARGGGTDVVSGRALLDRVQSYLRQVTPSLAVLDALACVAALGDASLEDLHAIATLVGLAPADLSGTFATLASGGLLERVHDRWSLQPVIRSPLVAQWFFGDTPRRPWTSLTSRFNDRAGDMAKVLVAAASVAPTPGLLGQVESWRGQLSRPTEWDESTWSTVFEYVSVSGAAADFAARAARDLLAAPPPRGTTIAWGTTSSRRIVATGVLLRCAREWLTASAIEGLLDLGMGDERERHQHPDHPLRAIGDLAKSIDPDAGHLLAIRQRILEVAQHWVVEDISADGRWSAFAEVVRYCYATEVSGNWTDPASFRELTLATGQIGADGVELLISEWDGIEATLANRLPETMPPQAVQQLIDLLHDWLGLAAGHARGEAIVDNAARDAALHGVKRMLVTVARYASARPGLALRLAGALGWHDFELDSVLAEAPLEIPKRLELFAGTMGPRGDVAEWITRRNDEVRQVAEELLALGPIRGCSALMELQEQAMLAREIGDARAAVAWHMAAASEDPAAWIPPSIELNLVELLGSMITVARSRGVQLDEQVIEKASVDKDLRRAVVNAVLAGTEIDDLAQRVLDGLSPNDLVPFFVLAGKPECDRVLEALLVHKTPAIRVIAALACGRLTVQGPRVPTAVEPAWEKAILVAAEVPVDPTMEWRLVEHVRALAADAPELCGRWFELQIPLAHDLSSWGRTSEILGVAAQLPSKERERLIRVFFARELRPQTFLHLLVGHDPVLLDRLFADGTLGESHVPYLFNGSLDRDTAALISALCARGVPDERVFDAIRGPRSWTGNESDEIKREIEWFHALAMDSATASGVRDVAVRRLEAELTNVLEQERRDEMNGW